MSRGETKKGEIILQYVEAYNDFDVDSMLVMLHSDIVFQNISNGEITAQTSGKSEFEALARKTTSLFKVRSQSVRSLRIQRESAVAEIDFFAIYAKDIPGGPKAGETLNLKGTSEFLFKDGLILSIIDRS